jgi:hypothetical protein
MRWRLANYYTEFSALLFLGKQVRTRNFPKRSPERLALVSRNLANSYLLLGTVTGVNETDTHNHKRYAN